MSDPDAELRAAARRMSSKDARRLFVGACSFANRYALVRAVKMMNRADQDAANERWRQRISAASPGMPNAPRTPSMRAHLDFELARCPRCSHMWAHHTGDAACEHVTLRGSDAIIEACPCDVRLPAELVALRTIAAER